MKFDNFKYQNRNAIIDHNPDNLTLSELLKTTIPWGRFKGEKMKNMKAWDMKADYFRLRRMTRHTDIQNEYYLKLKALMSYINTRISVEKDLMIKDLKKKQKDSKNSKIKKRW